MDRFIFYTSLNFAKINQIQKIEEIMFYSPKKEVEKYVILKNHEITVLRQQLQTEKATEQNLQAARKKLENIKNLQKILISENHEQLIQTLQKTEQKKKSTQQDLSLKRKQLDLKSSQKNDLLSMKKQLLSKVQKAKENLAIKKTKNIQFSSQRNQQDELIKKLAQQNQQTRKENQEISTLVKEAKKELSISKTNQAKTQQTSTSIKNKIKTLTSQVLNQKQTITTMKAEHRIQQLRIENLEIKIKYLRQVKTNLLEQKEKINYNKLLSKEKTQLNMHQAVSSGIISSIVKTADSIKESKLIEKEISEREIKQKLVELELTECVQNELRQQAQNLQDKIRKAQENSAEIKNQLKSLQIKDPDLISIIIRQSKDEKIDDKKFFQPKFDNKQNTPLKQARNKKSVWQKMNLSSFATTSQEQSESLLYE